MESKGKGSRFPENKKNGFSMERINYNGREKT
jgi:hypothetical protein